MTSDPQRELPSLLDAIGLPTPEKARRLVVLLGVAKPRPAAAPAAGSSADRAA